MSKIIVSPAVGTATGPKPETAKKVKTKTSRSFPLNSIPLGVPFYESQARDAYTLASLIYENATGNELEKYGTAEQRYVLLGLFAYQTMSVAAIRGTPKATTFRALGYNKLGFGKNMRLCLAIARKQVPKRNENRGGQGTEGGGDVESGAQGRGKGQTKNQQQ